MKVYLDTNIFLDLLLDRPLSLYTEQILDRAISCEFYIVISDIIIHELEKYASFEQIELLKNRLGPKAIMVLRSKKRDSLFSLHYPDDIHLLTAIDNDCDVFVTNDFAFFDISAPVQILSSRTF